MLNPRRVRAVAKRAVGWEAGPTNPLQAALRSFFLRDMDVAIRYGPVLADAARAGRILEVGSGPYGIAPFLQGPVFGVDLDFTGPRHERLHPALARGEALPFADETFDLVLCFDVMEHVPRDHREAVLRELARVSRGRLVIAFPFGDAARKADAEAAGWYEASQRGSGTWLAEHLEQGLPEDDEIAAWIQVLGDPVRRVPYSPIWLFRMARREEAFFRPHLSLLRRLVMPMVNRRLWCLPAHENYRLLLEFHLRRGVGA